MSETNKDIDASRISKLFDVRLIVGVLMSLYGLVLLITGLVQMHPHKSPGMHLNIWTGLAMVVVGAAMLAWMRLRPLAPPDPNDLTEAGPQESRAG